VWTFTWTLFRNTTDVFTVFNSLWLQCFTVPLHWHCLDWISLLEVEMTEHLDTGLMFGSHRQRSLLHITPCVLSTAAVVGEVPCSRARWGQLCFLFFCFPACAAFRCCCPLLVAPHLWTEDQQSQEKSKLLISLTLVQPEAVCDKLMYVVVAVIVVYGTVLIWMHCSQNALPPLLNPSRAGQKCWSEVRFGHLPPGKLN